MRILATILVGLVIVACATPSILDAPSTTSVYPCGSPLLAWCPGEKTCCAADGEEACIMSGAAAGTCEATSEPMSGVGIRVTRHHAQVAAY